MLASSRCGWLAVAALLAAGPASAQSLSVEDAVARALATSPEVLEAEAALLVARGERSAALLFVDNPSASAQRSLDGERTEASVLQPLSLTGEGWFARSAASRARDAAEARLVRARLVAAAAVRGVWAEAVVARLQAELATEGMRVANGLRVAAEAKLAVGEASHLEVRIARLAESEAAERVLAARARERDALVLLAGRVSGVTHDVELPADPTAAAPSGTGPVGMRSDVEAAEADARSARAALARERAATLPTVGVGVFYEQDAGVTLFGPSVAIQLPLWDRNQSGVAAARGQKAIAVAEAERRARVAAAEQAGAQSALAGAPELRPVPEIRAEAVEALASVDAGYQGGELDLATALVLQRHILDGQVAALEAALGVTELRLSLLLANDDPALLPGGAP